MVGAVVRQDKSRAGRVTPKGSAGSVGASGVSREPIRIESGFSTVVPFLMFGLMGLGLVVILLNYMVTSFGAPSNWYLLAGLGLILAGIIAATQYR